MRCPRCKEENLEDSKVCANCGLKLKISCPRCHSLNAIGQERCSKCKLKLIAFCPECKAPNFPNVKTCRKCGETLLVECPECKALNPKDRKVCLRCKFNLEEKEAPEQIEQIAEEIHEETPEERSEEIPEEVSETVTEQPEEVQEEQAEQSQEALLEEKPEEKAEPVTQKTVKVTPELKPPVLDEYAVLSVEFINLAAIRAKLKNPEIESKLRNYFLHIVGLNANKFKEEYVVLSEQIAAIEFKYQTKTKNSALYSILAARDILKEISELNYKIQNTLKIKLKVKIGISLVDSQAGRYYSQIERSAATAENVVVSTKIYNLTSDKFDFELMGSVPVGDKLATVYKLTDPLGQNSNPDIVIEEPRIEFHTEEAVSEAAQIENKEEKPSREFSQDNITGFLIRKLTEVQEGCIIGISAPDGAGKTTIVSTAKQLLSGRKIDFLIGQCRPVNKVIPMAYFQDVLKSLFKIPLFITNIEEARKAVSQTLLELNIKDKYIEKVIFNLLAMENIPDDMDIFTNRQKIFESIKIILAAIKAENTIALVIEDFEFIDSSSLDCIKYLVNTGFLDEKSQIIITHSTEVNLNSQFDYIDKPDRIFDIGLKSMSKEEADKLISGMLNGHDLIPPKLNDKIYRKSKGMPAYIEQVLWLLFEAGAVYNDNGTLKFNPEAADLTLPDTTEEIIKIRLNRLNKASALTMKILLNACTFGQRFMLNLLRTTIETDDQQFINALNLIESSGIFIKYDQFSLMFKNRIIYNFILSQGFSEEEKIKCHTDVLRVLDNYTKVSSAMLAVHAEIAGLLDIATNHWDMAAKEAIFSGDIRAYMTARQRLLALLENIDIPDKDNIKLSIYEEAGRINFEVNPEEAIPYLSKAIIERERKGDTVKIIELTGYLARSSELTGNYSGVIECVDKALSKINQENQPLEYALLNYCKLDAVFNSGKIEEAVYLAKNDTLPILKAAISKNKSISGLSTEEFNYAEMETELILARAYAIQGNKESVNIANSLVRRASELGITEMQLQAKLVEALYKTLQGELNSVSAILEYLKPLINNMPDNSDIKLYWGFIKLLTDIFSGRFEDALNIIDSVIIIAEESRNYNILVVAQLLKGKLYKELHDLEKAKAFYNDTLLYCSEKKMALGAILGWYLFAETEVAESNVQKAQEIAEKALEIVQRAGINISFLLILLQRQLGEIQIIKGDFEAARMYVEQALVLARKLELYLPESKLFLTYGKIFQEIAAISEEDKQSNANLAHEYFMESLDIAQNLENEHMILQIEEEFTNLSTFCQLSGIIL